jgi:transcriptional regulator with XRE-family HTH domain
MSRRAHSYSLPTLDAIAVLGRQITAERRERRWTQGDLAQRAGISVGTLLAIEKGSSAAAIGTVFEIAQLLGIPLVGATDPAARKLIDTRLALLPSRVDARRTDDDDDF